MNAPRRGDAGLSLVEVLVSLAIFAVIGVAGLAVLNTVARTGERTEGRLERLAEVDRAFLVIRRDLAQIAVGGVTLDDTSFAFRRADQTGFVRIGFVLEDAVLVRRIGTDAVETVNQQLLSGVTSVDWRLMDRAQRWHSVWPSGEGAQSGRPVAAELTLEVWRAETDTPLAVTRLMVLPAGQGR